MAERSSDNNEIAKALKQHEAMNSPHFENLIVKKLSNGKHSYN